VTIELLAIPALCDAYVTLAIFSLANLLIVTLRIREEERASEQANGRALPDLPRFLPRLLPRSESHTRSVRSSSIRSKLQEAGMLE
jgi:hypothetical protein